jgi:hypothetical protein
LPRVMLFDACPHRNVSVNVKGMHQRESGANEETSSTTMSVMSMLVDSQQKCVSVSHKCRRNIHAASH